MYLYLVSLNFTFAGGIFFLLSLRFIFISFYFRFHIFVFRVRARAVCAYNVVTSMLKYI